MLDRQKLRYLRVSLVSTCNLNCFYCRPSREQTVRSAAQPDPKRFQSAIRLLHKLGVSKIRFTGGEPTLYKRLPEFVAYVRCLDDSLHLAMTSNGLLLPKLARRLAEAGLDSVNISLDTLDRRRFESITGVDALDRVVAGIEAAVAHVPKVKLNCVLMKGLNDQEAEQLVRFADCLGIDIRFIESMPTRSVPANDRRFVAGDAVRFALPFGLTPAPSEKGAAARYYHAQELKVRVGFIDPVSHPFCADCDRLRLASDGRLFGCLFSGRAVNIFDYLKAGEQASTEAVERVINGKRYLGCAGAVRADGDLPSFLSMGG